MKRRRPRMHIYYKAEPLEPEIPRGELRLAGEVLIAREAGYIVPLHVLRRVEATVRTMKG